MPPALVVLLLSMLLGLQPAATDLYLPALPSIVSSLQGTTSQAQLTLSAMLLAFGLSQLVWGPVSDRFGRKRIAMIGVSGYTVGALGAALAPNMEVLILMRMVQGGFMGAAMVCGRAIVRDLYAGADGARVMSKGLSGLGAIACVSAPIGSLVASTLGWRAAMGVLVLLGLSTLLLVALRMKETLAHPDPHALRPGPMARNWAHILSNRTFWSFGLLATASYGALFTVLATSSFVLIRRLGVPEPLYGLQLAMMSGCYILGTFLCRRLISTVGIQRTVAFGGLLSISGASLMALNYTLGFDNPWTVVIPIYIVVLGHGIHQSCGQSGAVSPFPRSAGAAAALSGCMMTLAAFITGLWLGPRMDDPWQALVIGLLFWGGSAALIAWTAVQKLSRPDA